MNIELLKQHVETSLKSIVVPELKKDGSNAHDFFMVDIPNKSFMLNHGGYPRSDIAAIIDIENIELQKSMLARLEEIPATSPNAGLTDAQIMLMHRSKYMQTPSETQSWLQDQLSLRDQIRYDAQLKAQLAAKAAASKVKKVDVPNTPET